MCRGARTGSARFCSRGWPEIMPLCPGAATAPTAGPSWRRAPWTRARQRCSLPSGARPLPSPPVPSGPLPEARPRLGLRRKPGHSTRLRDFSFTSCAHPAWPGFCFQLTGCWRGILKVQACRSDDRVIVTIQLSRCTLLPALGRWALSSPRPRPHLVQPSIRHEPSPRTVLDMFNCNIV